MAIKQTNTDTKKMRSMQKMLHVFSHDLRNPLLNIQALVQEVEFSAKDSLGESEDLSESLEMLRETAIKMDEMITGSNEVYHCMFDPLECEAVDMHEVFMRSFAKLKLGEQGISFECPALVTVYADPLAVQRLVIELLDNAGKALVLGSEEGQKKIKVSCSEEEDWARFYVEDCGCRFEEEEVARVFEPFFVGRRFLKGLGLGLTRAKSWVENHGGTIHIESITTCSSVSFSLPKTKEAYLKR